MGAQTTRERQERFAKDFDGVHCLDWSAALDRILARRGLSFFTDEQVEEIVSAMVERARFSQRLRVRNRQAIRSAA
ncbi:hypothetical protein [Bosea sp. AS-1]|uniref:hypothetical protein n=1 Tax=Bosea sp. AS-1 TaxID=2015316 RepID=UPI000B78974A|nr:hypothetical protein [Bosea sp. AS-1]